MHKKCRIGKGWESEKWEQNHEWMNEWLKIENSRNSWHFISNSRFFLCFDSFNFPPLSAILCCFVTLLPLSDQRVNKKNNLSTHTPRQAATKPLSLGGVFVNKTFRRLSVSYIFHDEMYSIRNQNQRRAAHTIHPRNEQAMPSFLNITANYANRIEYKSH